jgi:hypothetical protein
MTVSVGTRLGPEGTRRQAIIRGTRSSMSLVPGARLGPYEIVAPLGAGGMSAVAGGACPRTGVMLTENGPNISFYRLLGII